MALPPPPAPGALDRLRARLEAVDKDLAALCLDGLATDEQAIALVDAGPDDEEPGGVWDAYDRRDVERLRWWASGARWRSVVPLEELLRRDGRLNEAHKAHLLHDLMAARLLKDLEAAPAA